VKNINHAEGLILKFQQKKEKEEREERIKELEVRLLIYFFTNFSKFSLIQSLIKIGTVQ
jgi:hypothetical protein